MVSSSSICRYPSVLVVFIAVCEHLDVTKSEWLGNFDEPLVARATWTATSSGRRAEKGKWFGQFCWVDWVLADMVSIVVAKIELIQFLPPNVVQIIVTQWSYENWWESSPASIGRGSVVESPCRTKRLRSWKARPDLTMQDLCESPKNLEMEMSSGSQNVGGSRSHSAFPAKWSADFIIKSSWNIRMKYHEYTV